MTTAMGEAFLSTIQDDALTLTSPAGTIDSQDVSCGYVGDGVGAVTFGVSCSSFPVGSGSAFGDGGAVIVPGAMAAFWTVGDLFGTDQLSVNVTPYLELLVTMSPPTGETYIVDPLTAATQIARVAMSRL